MLSKDMFVHNEWNKLRFRNLFVKIWYYIFLKIKKAINKVKLKFQIITVWVIFMVLGGNV